MCEYPVTLDDGTVVGCRSCWQCKKERVTDYVGRCIAEQKNSDATYALTLTYDDRSMDGEFKVNASTLVYADVQKFLKRLRRKYSVRYIVSGEYGSRRGRAHWHIVLFFNGKYPFWAINKMIDIPEWPYGHVYAQKSDYRGFRYVLKYLMKDQTQSVKLSHFALSKKPPIGHDFFMELANEYAASGLAPRSFSYSFSGVNDAKGKTIKFTMRGKTRDNFMDAFLSLWPIYWPNTPIPHTDCVMEYEDKLAAAKPETFDEIKYRMELKREERKRYGFNPEKSKEYEQSLRRSNADWRIGKIDGVNVAIEEWDDKFILHYEGIAWDVEENYTRRTIERRIDKLERSLASDAWSWTRRDSS